AAPSTSARSTSSTTFHTRISARNSPESGSPLPPGQRPKAVEQRGRGAKGRRPSTNWVGGRRSSMHVLGGGGGPRGRGGAPLGLGEEARGVAPAVVGRRSPACPEVSLAVDEELQVVGGRVLRLGAEEPIGLGRLGGAVHRDRESDEPVAQIPVNPSGGG